MIRSQQYIKLNSGAKEIQQINPQLKKLNGHIGLGMSMCPCVRADAWYIMRLGNLNRHV